jgi:hypothetical protein
VAADQGRLFPPAPKRVRGRVTDGLEATIRALVAAGRLEDVDAVWIALARESCAQYQQASRDPDVSGYVRNAMLRGSIDAVEHLPIGPDAADTTSLVDLLAALDDPAHPGPPDDRRPGR